MSENNTENVYDYHTKWWKAPNINTTWQDDVVEDKNKKWVGGNINPKMFKTKEELNLKDWHDYSISVESDRSKIKISTEIHSEDVIEQMMKIAHTDNSMNVFNASGEIVQIIGIKGGSHHLERVRMIPDVEWTHYTLHDTYIGMDKEGLKWKHLDKDTGLFYIESYAHGDPSNCSNDDRMDYTENKTPNYYIGRHYKYEARKIIEDFDLSYNSGVVVSYLLRAGKKTEEGISNIDKHIEDVVKSINHLEFELEVLNNRKNEEEN